MATCSSISTGLFHSFEEIPFATIDPYNKRLSCRLGRQCHPRRSSSIEAVCIRTVLVALKKSNKLVGTHTQGDERWLPDVGVLSAAILRYDITMRWLALGSSLRTYWYVLTFTASLLLLLLHGHSSPMNLFGWLLNRPHCLCTCVIFAAVFSHPVAG